MNLRNDTGILIFLTCLFISANSNAQIKGDDGLTISGYVDTYYSYDFNDPESHNRPAFIYNYNRTNEVNVNLAMIKLSYSKERVRGNLSLMAGTYSNANLTSETGLLKNIYEANAGVKLSKKTDVWLDAGIMNSHIGFESAVGKDCWTLTRSLPAEGTPYYETGARFSYNSEDSKWYLAGLMLNGWQRTTRVNGNNTLGFGTQVTYKASPEFLINNSTYFGNDNPDSTKAMRYFADTYITYMLSKHFAVTAGYDIGIQQKSKGSSDYFTWYSPVVILKTIFNEYFSAAGRFEYFHDPSQVIFATGTPNGFRTLGYSLNIDYQVTSQALLRIEGRSLDSKDAIFIKGSELKNSNFAITSSLSLTF